MKCGRDLIVPFALLVIASGCGKPTQRPVLPKDVTDFNLLYAQNCAGCHGANGKNGAAQPLNDPAYLAIVPENTLHDVVANGRQGTLMPAFARSQGGPLYPNQVDIVVRGIEQHWAKPSELNGAALPEYDPPQGGDPNRGQQVFAAACAGCHSDKGKAGSVTNASYLALTSDQGLRTSTIMGRPELGMPDWRSEERGHALSDQEITNVIAYLSSLRPAQSGAALTPGGTGAGQSGAQTRGNEGSGYGPGSPRKEDQEGISGTGGSSQSGGAASGKKTTPPPHR